MSMPSGPSFVSSRSRILDSVYSLRSPGLFFFLGTGDSPALHTSNFDFDDSLLAVGADFFLRLATTL